LLDCVVVPSLDLINQFFVEGVPHNAALGVRITQVREAGAVAELPFDPKLVGNPEFRFLHGGVITSVLDGVAGLAIFAALKQPLRIATIDLRIDYLKPSTPDTTLICEAECYKVTQQVAFVRGLAHHGETSDPIASCVGTFRIFRPREDEP
jgi:uncharacterized protein (TIGR00369 family)